MKYSLNTKMVVFGLVMHSLIWILAASASSYTTVNVIFKSLDHQLQEQAKFVRFSARLLGSFYQKFDVKDDYDPLKEGAIISDSIGFGDVNIVVWTPDGQLIFRSSKAPGFDFPRQDGFSGDQFMIDGNNEKWRLYSETVDGIFLVTVGMSTKKARQSAIDFGLQALYPMVLIIPLTIIIVYVGSRRGLRAINKVAQDVANRNPKSLVPISEDNIPQEISPLVSSINGLLRTLESAIENEHRFTSNAAHELQTPLAAIKTELQLCQRQSNNPEVTAVLDRINSRVERAVYTVKQLLTLARIESENTPLDQRPLDLCDIVVEDLADLAHLAIDRDITLNFIDNAPWLVNGDKEILSILVKNLLTNAFRYTPSGGTVEISAKVNSETIEFYVANDSAAIAPAQRELMVKRFYRVPGNDAQGAGLGLSIVKRIVAVHGATLSIDDWREQQGVMFKITFNRYLS